MPRIDFRITTGDIITLIVIIAGGLFGYATLSATTNQHTQRLQVIETQYMRSDIASERRSREDERWDEIKVRLTKIEAALAAGRR